MAKMATKKQNFATKVLNNRFSSGFLPIKTGSDDFNMSFKFEFYSMHIFFKMATYKFPGFRLRDRRDRF